MLWKNLFLWLYFISFGFSVRRVFSIPVGMLFNETRFWFSLQVFCKGFQEQRKSRFPHCFFVILYYVLFCIKSTSLKPLGHHCPVTAIRLDKNGRFFGESPKRTHSLDLSLWLHRILPRYKPPQMHHKKILLRLQCSMVYQLQGLH